MNVFMKTQSKALVLSIILHASLVLVFLGLNKYTTGTQDILMVDFTLEPNNPKTTAFVTASRPLHSNKVNEQSPIKGTITADEALAYDQGRFEETISQSSEQISRIDHDFPDIIDKDIDKVTDNKLLISHKNVLPAVSSDENDTEIPEKNASSPLLHQPKSVSQSGYMKNHFTYIRDMIQRKLIYPKIAREMGWEGQVAVSFFIASDGLAKEIKIAASSGRMSLDKNALLAVQNASPFPKPPVEAYIRIPIVYRLH
jgi:TonB family protein